MLTRRCVADCEPPCAGAWGRAELVGLVQQSLPEEGVPSLDLGGVDPEALLAKFDRFTAQGADPSVRECPTCAHSQVMLVFY